MEEIFEYRLTKLDPISGDHIDPPSVAIYETLLTKDSAGQPAAGLAESWQVSANQLTWQLRIRRDAVFHSGAPCDARAVLEALELCRWAAGPERQIWYWDPVDQVRVVGDDVVEVTLLYPCPRLPVLLWGTHTAIVNPDSRLRHGEEFGVTMADGTGPYRLVAFSPDEVRVELSQQARAVARRGTPSTILWRSITNPAERMNAMSLPNVDVVRAPTNGSQTPELDSSWRLDSQPESSQIYLALNFADPRGFGDRDIRRAVEAFVDREELVQAALFGRGDARRSPVPVADEFAHAFDPQTVPALSHADARSTLELLGFTRGVDGLLERDGRSLSIDCVVQDTSVFRSIANVLGQQLMRAGVRLDFRFVEPFEDFYRAVESGPASFISKWLWPDAMEAIMGFSRTTCMGAGGGNWQGATTARVDAAFDRFLQADSHDALLAASADAQRVFMTELPYIPLCSETETLAVRRRVEGFGLSPRLLYPAYSQITTEDSL